MPVMHVCFDEVGPGTLVHIAQSRRFEFSRVRSGELRPVRPWVLWALQKTSHAFIEIRQSQWIRYICKTVRFRFRVKRHCGIDRNAEFTRSIIGGHRLLSCPPTSVTLFVARG